MERHPSNNPRVKYFSVLCLMDANEDAKKMQFIISSLEDVVAKAPYLDDANELLVNLYDKNKMGDKIKNFVETKVFLYFYKNF